jgi:hypothetical protein
VSPDPSEQQKHRVFQSLGDANLRRIELSNQSFGRHLKMKAFREVHRAYAYRSTVKAGC